jgi:hypothetical protein
MNSCRLSSDICPVRVSHWIAAIHSSSLSRTSRAKACRCRTRPARTSASRGSWAVLHRCSARSVMFSSVTMSIGFSGVSCVMRAPP